MIESMEQEISKRVPVSNQLISNQQVPTNHNAYPTFPRDIESFAWKLLNVGIGLLGTLA